MKIEEKYIFKSYTYFYEQFYKYKPTYTESAKKLCASFITILEERYKGSVGETFLWNYFLYQFMWWKELEITSRNKKINLSFIIGRKAFLRYLDRDEEYDWQLQRDQMQFDKEKFKNFINVKKNIDTSTTYDGEEMYKEQLLNQEKGLSNCIVNTTLFKKTSKSCQQCRFVEECKDLQKEMFPKIYRKRSRE